MRIFEEDTDYCPACINRARVKLDKIRSQIDNTEALELIEDLNEELEDLVPVYKTLYQKVRVSGKSEKISIDYSAFCGICGFSQSFYTVLPWKDYA